jgi:ABC-type uncharacterized transport system substrate-binding protein
MKKKKHFEVLTMDEQVNITWRGEFISSIKLKNYCLMLYLVEESYFVEVFYDARKKEIMSLKLADDSRMQLYADKIDLQKLF